MAPLATHSPSPTPPSHARNESQINYPKIGEAKRCCVGLGESSLLLLHPQPAK
jgi:hypothetical protein